MFTRLQAEQMLYELLSSQSEIDEAECKSSASERVQDAICGMSNRRDRNGGIVFVGVGPDYTIVGIQDLEKAQEKIVNWANDCFNVELRVSPEILEYEGKKLIAIIVPPAPPGFRPCYFKKHSPYDGAWIRVGNSTRKMTRDEVGREIAADNIARGLVPSFDMMAIMGARPELLDEPPILQYIDYVKRARPGSRIDRLDRHDLLNSLRAIAQ